jgi:hypothetical protein
MTCIRAGTSRPALAASAPGNGCCACAGVVSKTTAAKTPPVRCCRLDRSRDGKHEWASRSTAAINRRRFGKAVIIVVRQVDRQAHKIAGFGLMLRNVNRDRN